MMGGPWLILQKSLPWIFDRVLNVPCNGVHDVTWMESFYLNL